MVSSAKKLLAVERTSLALQGAAAVLFGLGAIIWPGITVEVLVYLTIAFLLVSGIAAVVLGLASLSKNTGKGLLLISAGLVEVAIGGVFLLSVNAAFETIVLVLALALIVRGLFSLVHGSGKKQPAKLRRTHKLLGALAVLVGLILLAYPVATVVALVWIVGLYALVSGLALIGISADMSKNVK